MQSNKFYKQVDLLLEILPLVMAEKDFALKGGTAINLFVRNMPRYSVDIDLTYIPIEDREESITSINNLLLSIKDSILKKIPSVHNIQHINSKLIISTQESMVKVEPNTIVRGAVFPCESIDLCLKAQSQFNKYLNIKCLSRMDLYGSKICATLDRQHPRDLFDIKLLLENEGITEDIKNAFLVYLISYPRPMSELLNPNLLDQRQLYESDFKDMASVDITYEDLDKSRLDLVEQINNSLDMKDKEFLLSIKKGEPLWNLINIKGVSDLPAVKWKLKNIQNMRIEKHKKSIEKLEKVLQV